MFRVEFHCDDKKLAKALNALVGIAHGQPNVRPIANAIGRGNRLLAKLNGSNTSEMFASFLRKKNIKEVRAENAREFCRVAGLSEGSYSNVLWNARKAGFLRKTGKGMKTVWKVL